MAARSAGTLLFRIGDRGLEVLLAHPGGPFFARKDEGAWTIPKGELDIGEEPLAALEREFEEEIGSPLPSGELIELGQVRQKSGKIVLAWALRGDLDTTTVKSNRIVIEWPPRSGKRLEIPEVDRAQWFEASEARQKINPAQASFIDRLEAHLNAQSSDALGARRR
jgi:predicted NUDIX family NTP pyrophosphohydrolase